MTPEMRGMFVGMKSQSPQVGAMFQTKAINKAVSEIRSLNPLKSGQCFRQLSLPELLFVVKVSIPSSRGNVSDSTVEAEYGDRLVKSQSPQVGAMFQTTLAILGQKPKMTVSIPSSRGNVSDYIMAIVGELIDTVSIPSSRGNVSDS